MSGVKVFCDETVCDHRRHQNRKMQTKITDKDKQLYFNTSKKTYKIFVRDKIFEIHLTVQMHLKE